MKNKILLLLFSLLLFSCSDNENNPTSKDIIVKKLKSVNYIDENFNHLNEVFVYENDLLKTHTYGNYEAGNYHLQQFSYDSNKKLTSIKHIQPWDEYVQKFFYNDKGKLIKITDSSSRNYQNLIYEGNLITLSTYENNGPLISRSLIEVDNKGKILNHKTIKYSYDRFINQECIYDNNDNLVTIINKNSTDGYDDYNEEFVYDTNPNPYYYAFQNVYLDIFYLNFFEDITNYFYKGFFPNNITNYDNGSIKFEYKYDEEGYPVERLRDGKSDVIFEYY